MSDAATTGHLDLERLSALLDVTDANAPGNAHLERCETCRLEFERLSRMRMALSGLADLDPPSNGWVRIREALDAREVGMAGSGGSMPRQEGPAEIEDARVARGVWVPSRVLSRWPAQVAAGFLLFAGGIVSGLLMTGTNESPAGGRANELPELVESSRPGARGIAQVTVAPRTDAAYFEALSELAEIRQPRLVFQGEPMDPVAAAERLMRLEALIDASREALNRLPADPVANGLLFQAVEERDYLAARLNESLSLATLEFR